MFYQPRSALLSTFGERWQPHSNTFHMPFSEIHEMKLILGLPPYVTPIITKHKREQLLDIINNDFDGRYTSTGNESFTQGGITQHYFIHACKEVDSHL